MNRPLQNEQRMLRLYWRVFAVTLLACGAGVLALVLIYQREPLPAVQSGLALCDTVPCWAGLEPGRTLAEDVPAVIDAHLPDEALFQPYQRLTSFVVTVPARNVLGAVSSRAGTVSTIRLNVVQPLEPLLLLLDVPRCIEWLDRSADLHVMNIYWEMDGVFIMSNLALSKSNPDLLTTTLNLWLPAPEAERPCDKPGQMNRWPGFAALR